MSVAVPDKAIRLLMAYTVSGGTLLLSVLLDAYRADQGSFDLPVRAMRTARRSRILGMIPDYRVLNAVPAFRHHIASDPIQDPLFFLSHRHYLVRGLSARERLSAALTHYRHQQTAFDAAYTDSVYLQGGLCLWSETVQGVTYDVTLRPGNDVLYEGGLSLVLNVDGGRVCVMSFSVVPTDMVLPDLGPYGQPDRNPEGGADVAHINPTDSQTAQMPTGPTDPANRPDHREIMFLTRKQLTSNHDYQKAFNAAFHRCTPGHLCFGALSGMAKAIGHRQVFGIEPERHPAWDKEHEPQFNVAYADFWLSLAGRKLSPLGYLIDVPMHLSPLDAMSAAKRKRAASRRAHIDDVSDSAHRIIASHLTSPA